MKTTRDGIEMVLGMPVWGLSDWQVGIQGRYPNPLQTITVHRSVLRNIPWIGEGPNNYEPICVFGVEANAVAVANAHNAGIAAARAMVASDRVAKRAAAARRNADWAELLNEAWRLASGDVDDCDCLEHYIESMGPTSSGFHAIREFIAARKVAV